ncbi:MAG: hypothetical protein K6C34_00190 [Alphaproteobacteria bacterium]|nr:hypothetical protein [Alphaproteobacteria bacterium]
MRKIIYLSFMTALVLFYNESEAEEKPQEQELAHNVPGIRPREQTALTIVISDENLDLFGYDRGRADEFIDGLNALFDEYSQGVPSLDDPDYDDFEQIVDGCIEQISQQFEEKELELPELVQRLDDALQDGNFIGDEWGKEANQILNDTSNMREILCAIGIIFNHYFDHSADDIGVLPASLINEIKIQLNSSPEPRAQRPHLILVD